MSLRELRNKLQSGFINCHAHIDRAGTASLVDPSLTKKLLTEKWKLVNDTKLKLTADDYYLNILSACLVQKNFNTRTVVSFIDLDSVAGDRAIQGAVLAREELKRTGVSLYIGNQTVGGFTKENTKLFEDNVDKLDFLGGLPKSDVDPDRHLDILFSTAKATGKKVHVHVDQLNIVEERETEWLAQKTIEYGLEGQVVAVHSISLSCHPKMYRNYVYNLSKDAGLQFVSCPSAWIDHPRTEILSPTHNSLTPIDEMLEWGLTVGIGTDNIEDIYKPFCNGDMMFEVRLALEAFKIYDVDTLVDIAYNNGLKILG
jgi:cytosine/adenosine deaminase-related metal-dependent hydrolase